MTVPCTYVDFSYSEARRRMAILASVDQLEHEDDPDLAYTAVAMFDGRSWSMAHIEGMRATSLVYGDQYSWITGDRGEVWKSDKGIFVKDQLPDSGLQGRHLGPPNQIRVIGGRLYVCGFAGQVYTQRGDIWVHMDDGLAEPVGTPDSIDLEAISGTGADDIYVVGSGGLIAHWNGQNWTILPVLTDVYLAGVRCFAVDRVMAVGDKGMVVEGDGKRWRVDQIPGAEEASLTDLELYRGKIYVAGIDELYVRDGSTWEVVKHGLEPVKTDFFKFTLGAERLWAMGSKRLNSFDGKKWKAHPDPDNG